METVVDGFTRVGASLLNGYKQAVETLEGRAITAGAGLSGGGTLAADRSLALDIAGLTALADAVDPAADYLPIYDASGAVIRRVSVGVLVPLSAKGDLLTHDGTAPQRLPVGSDGQVLTAKADGSAAWDALPESGAMHLLASFSGQAADYVLNPIPAGYTSLRIVGIARTDRAVENWSMVSLQVNGLTSAIWDFSDFLVISHNATNNSQAYANQTLGYIGKASAAGASANMAGVFECTIPFYANSTFYKGFVARYMHIWDTTYSNQQHGMLSGRVRTTDAITHIRILPSHGGNFIAGTQINVYGLT